MSLRYKITPENKIRFCHSVLFRAFIVESREDQIAKRKNKKAVI